MSKPLLLILVMILCGACFAPDQHDESRYGVVRVAFGPPAQIGPDAPGPWRPDQLSEMRAELLDLNHLGASFVEVSEGEADVVVRPFDAGPGCRNGAGTYWPASDFVEVDPVCCQGYSQLRHVMAHEVMHFYTEFRWGWIGHICERDANLCSVWVHAADAVLSPDLTPSVAPTGTRVMETFLDSIQAVYVDGVPTAADLDLIARCQVAGGCM